MSDSRDGKHPLAMTGDEIMERVFPKELVEKLKRLAQDARPGDESGDNPPDSSST